MSHWNTCRGGGGLVVSEFNFYFDDPISNPVKVYSSSVKMLLEKNENTQKEVGMVHLKNTVRKLKSIPTYVLKCKSSTSSTPTQMSLTWAFNCY